MIARAGAAQLTPPTTGRDNRSTLTFPQTLLPGHSLSVLIPLQQGQGPDVPPGSAGLGDSVRWLNCGLDEARRHVQVRGAQYLSTTARNSSTDIPQTTVSLMA